jgi:putative selenium metabolism hydrolase
VRFAQELVRAPSPSGSEGPAAEAAALGLRGLGFDAVETDAAGNVYGVIEGDRPGRTIHLNTHLDTVSIGDPAEWPHDPFGGVVAEGRLWGRGSVDNKANLAVQAVAAVEATRDRAFRGRVVVSGVVQEEVCGLGARFLAERLESDVVILGEPTSLRVARGHRGRVEVYADFQGRIAHAAKPELGVNPLYPLGRFLSALESVSFPVDPELGASTASPTLVASHPESTNVIPEVARVLVDYRNIPGDPLDEILARFRALAEDASVYIPEDDFRSGGVTMRLARVSPPYKVPANHPDAVLAASIAAEFTALPEETTMWWFCTDAPYFASQGAIVIGFAPGDADLAHTSRESVPLEALEAGVDATSAIVRALLARDVA